MTHSRQVAALMSATLFAFGASGCASERANAEPPLQPSSYETPPDTTGEPKGLPPAAPAEDNPVNPQPSGMPQPPDALGPDAATPAR